MAKKKKKKKNTGGGARWLCSADVAQLRLSERVTGVTEKLAAIAIQEQCLEEWTYKNYSYNALEHMLLNE